MIARAGRILAGLVVAGGLGLGLLAPTSGASGIGSRASCPTGGLGDPVHPNLGVPDVNVRSSETHLDVASGLASYTAQTTLRFTATRSLRCAALDYAHGRVLGAAVDGRAAKWFLRPDKVVVELGRSVTRGSSFDVVVRTHTDVPDLKSQPVRSYPPGVLRFDGVLQEVGQPSRAHYLVPMADYPAQKAPWRVVVDVPRGMTLAFSGRTISVRPLGGGRRRFTAASDGPIATDILQLAVGRFALVHGPTVDGVRIRSYLPPSKVAKSRPGLALLPGEIRTMTRLLGRFPFPRYGVLLTPFGGDLEVQTLSLFPSTQLYKSYLPIGMSGMLHELVHQWFGDSVSVARWTDLWLAEGHAEYYQYTYGHPYDFSTHKPYATTPRSFWERLDASVRRKLPKTGPIADPRQRGPSAPYASEAYDGGAVALYALQARLGQGPFDRIERAFVRTYRNRSASTEDYLSIVRQVAGTATRTWLSHWLYSIHPPPLPHPADPVTRR